MLLTTVPAAGYGPRWLAHERSTRELGRARLRDRDGGLTAEAPAVRRGPARGRAARRRPRARGQGHADPALAGRTVDAPAEHLRGRTRGHRVEVLWFTVAACARAAGLGCTARLVVSADYAPAALVRSARRHGVGGVCVEHSPAHCAAPRRVSPRGLSVTTGTLDEPAPLDSMLLLCSDAVTQYRLHTLWRQPPACPRWRPDQPPGRSSVARMRGCPGYGAVRRFEHERIEAAGAARHTRRWCGNRRGGADRVDRRCTLLKPMLRALAPSNSRSPRQ